MTNLTEKWVNIYKSKEIGSYWSGAFCYETKEEAVKDLADKKNYLTTVNIEDMLNLQTQNTKLKELLKECREILYIEEMVAGNPRYIDELKILIKRINQVLANNQIQANTVACNKIQEKNNV